MFRFVSWAFFSTNESGLYDDFYLVKKRAYQVEDWRDNYNAMLTTSTTVCNASHNLNFASLVETAAHCSWQRLTFYVFIALVPFTSYFPWKTRNYATYFSLLPFHPFSHLEWTKKFKTKKKNVSGEKNWRNEKISSSSLFPKLTVYRVLCKTDEEASRSLSSRERIAICH